MSPADMRVVRAIKKARTFDEVCTILEISSQSPEAWCAWMVWLAWKGVKP